MRLETHNAVFAKAVDESAERVGIIALPYTLCGMQHFASRLVWPSHWESVSLLLRAIMDIEDNTVLLLLILCNSEFYSDNAN